MSEKMALISHYKYILTGFHGKIIDVQIFPNIERKLIKVALSIEKTGSVEGAPR